MEFFNQQKNKLEELFDEMILSEEANIELNINNIDFYSLFCKAAIDVRIFHILSSCNLCLFKYEYQDIQSILLIFSIPSSSNNDNRHMSERTMEVVRLIEETFITVDHMFLKEAKEDKFNYLVIVKNIQEDKNEE